MEYKKQSGSAEAGGQFYEIKLAMLFLLRANAACRRGEIDHFHLAANLEAAHPFDDIVLKYTKDELTRIILVQAKFKKKEAITWAKLMAPSNKGDFSARFYLKGYLAMNLSDEEVLKGPYERREYVLYTNAKMECKNESLTKEKTIKIMQIRNEEMFKVQFNSEIYDILKIPTDFSTLVDELVQCVRTHEYKPEIFIFRTYRNHLQQSVIGFEASEASKGGCLFSADFLSGSMTMGDEIRALRQVLFDKLRSNKEDDSQLAKRLSEIRVRIKKGHAGTASVKPKSELKAQLSEDEVRGFLDDFLIAAGQPGEKELEDLMKDEIASEYEVDKNDSGAIYSDVHSRMQRWWKDGNHYLTENDDWFEDSKINLSRRLFVGFIESAKKEFNSTTLVYKSEELESFYDSHRLITISSSNLTHFLNAIKICQTLEKFNAKYMILSQHSVEDKLDEVFDAFNNDYDILVIVGEKSIPNDIFRVLKRRKQKKLILIGKSVKSTGLPTVTISLNVGFNNLTVESQNLIMKKTCIRLLGCNVLFGDLFKPKLRHLISNELLAQIENMRLLEIGHPLCNLGDMESYNIPRKLSRKSKNIVVYHKLEELRPDDNSKFILICAEPGMGKSHLLSSIQAKSFMWKYRINLADKLKILSKKDMTVLSFFKEACDMNDLELELFKNYYESIGGVVLFFDGFDEIVPDYKDLVLGLLKSLASSKVDQIWITTRPCFKEELENELDTQAYTLEPFSIDDQKKFLRLFWKQSDDSQAEHFLDEFSLAINDPKGAFSSNPLQLKMAAELYDEIFLDRKLNLLMIYEKFFIKKFYQKLQVSSSIVKSVIDKVYTSVKLEHQKLAMFALFDDNELSLLFSSNEINEAKIKMKDIEEGNEKSGVIQSIIDSRPIFVHRTFAEYFAATWLASNLDIGIGDFLMNVGFFDTSNITLKCFFDMTVANDVTRMVLDNDLVAVDALPQNMLDAVDKGGRTPLHLASSYGYLPMMRILIENGASVSSVDRIMEWTPFSYARVCRQWLATTALIFSGADCKDSFAVPVDREFLSIGSLALGDRAASLLAADDVYQMSHLNSLKFNNFLFVRAIDLKKLRANSVWHDEANAKLKKGANVNVKNSEGITPLHTAVISSRVAAVQTLMKNGADVNAKSDNGLTPLHLASHTGHYDLVKQLIERGGDVLARDASNETPLHLAIERDHYEVACLLIDSGADVNAKNDIGLTPVHLATSYGDLKTTKKLIAGGANVDDRDAKHHTALHLAATHGSVGVINHLIHNRADVKARDKLGFTPLHHSCQLYYGSYVKLLIQAGADVNAKCEYGLSPLHMAARFGNMKLAQCLITNGSDPNAESNDHMTSLHLAIFHGYDQIAKMLLANGADVERKTESGFTPLHTASEKGNTDMLKSLIAKGSDLNATSNNQMTALHLAAMRGHVQIVKELLDNGAHLHERDEKGMTALCHAVVREHYDAVQVLMDRGADINIKFNNFTALHVAVAKQNLNLVKKLVAWGCDVNIKGENDMIALHEAIVYGFDEIAAYLIDNGSDVFSKMTNGFTPLHTAAELGRVEIAKYLIKSTNDLNIKAPNELTPLHVAALQGNTEVAILLVDGGADVHSVTIVGYTALHIATEKENLILVKHIMANGGDPNAKNNDRVTPFHLAVLMGQNEIAIELIKSKIHYKDEDGFTALHLAAQLGNLNIVKYLIANGSDLNAKKKDDIIPLHLAIIKEHENISIQLIKSGSDLKLKSDTDMTALHMAAIIGNVKIIRCLIAKGCALNDAAKGDATALHLSIMKRQDDAAMELVRSGCDVSCKKGGGYTALHLAAEKGNLNMVKYLIANKSFLNAKTNDLLTPLHVAAYHGKYTVVVYLIEIGADVFPKDQDGYTALHWAIDRNHIKIAKYLIKNGSNLDETSNTGTTPLHRATILGCDNVVIHLLRKGCNVDLKDNHGYTALHWAAQKGYINILRYLIANGSDLNAQTNGTKTPLQIAIIQEQDAIVEELIVSGCDVNYKAIDGFTALHVAAIKGKISYVQSLIKNGSEMNARAVDDMTPLHFAIDKGHDNVAIHLINCGCDLNSKNFNGYTPLHVAAETGNLAITEYLIKKKCDVNAKAVQNLTPLHLAILYGHEEVVKLLIENGSNVNEKAANLSAIHFAVLWRDKDMVRYLMEKGCDPNL